MHRRRLVVQSDVRNMDIWRTDNHRPTDPPAAGETLYLKFFVHSRLYELHADFRTSYLDIHVGDPVDDDLRPYVLPRNCGLSRR